MCDALVRRQAGVSAAIEIRVAIIGNVDSGKSTLVGVLTRAILDDGRGLARSKVRQTVGVGVAVHCRMAVAGIGWLSAEVCE